MKMLSHTKIFILNLSLGLILACNPKAAVTEQVSREDSGPEIVELSQAQFTTSALSIGTFSREQFTQSVRCNGMLDVPPRYKAAISPSFGGFVKRIDLLPGQKVKKGQVLVSLENTEYLKIQQTYLEAKNQQKFLLAEYERQKELLKDSITSQKSFLKAEADYLQTASRLQALYQTLKMMPINPDQVNVENLVSQIYLRAPFTGYVEEINVNLGTFLQPNDVALSLINTDHLHLELNVFENDIAHIKEGQNILFRLQSEPDSVYRAEVHLIGKSIDPEHRTIGIHAHIKAGQNEAQFVPGMYLEAEIQTEAGEAYALPAEAVVEVDDQFFVLLRKKDQTRPWLFEKRQVEIGKTNQAYVEILNYQDFASDASFLINGAFDLIQ